METTWFSHPISDHVIAPDTIWRRGNNIYHSFQNIIKLYTYFSYSVSRVTKYLPMSTRCCFHTFKNFWSLLRKDLLYTLKNQPLCKINLGSWLLTIRWRLDSATTPKWNIVLISKVQWMHSILLISIQSSHVPCSQIYQSVSTIFSWTIHLNTITVLYTKLIIFFCIFS